MSEAHDKRTNDAWRRTRALYTIIYNVNAGKKGKKPEELMPLPGDHIKPKKWFEELNNAQRLNSVKESMRKFGLKWK